MKALPRSALVRAPRVAGALWGVALAIAACEPLDIALFPASSDAGVQLPSDAGALAREADAGATGEPSPPPADGGSPLEPCLPGATACEACVQAGNCPVGRVCHPRSGDCVVPCSDVAPVCPAPSVCSPLGVCVACLDDIQCPSATARVCDTDRGVCVECVDADDCTAEPLERPVCLPASQRCGCATDDDCPAGVCETREGHCELNND